MEYQKNLKLLESYLPNLRQSWILLGLTAIIGMLVAALGTLAITFAVPSASLWADLILYPLVFLPAALYIFGELRNRRDLYRLQNITDFKSVPLNSNNFGKVGLPLSFLIIFLLIFSFNIATEPLYTWMGVSDFLRDFYENMKLNPWSTFLTVAIFAPLFEELLCRGIILRGLLQHTSPMRAILWSAFMFAVMHLNPWQALPAFMVGLFMGWIYWKTGSLWATIFIHFVNNASSFLITILFPQLGADVTFASLMPNKIYVIVLAASIIFTLGAFLFLDKNYDKSISTKI